MYNSFWRYEFAFCGYFCDPLLRNVVMPVRLGMEPAALDPEIFGHPM
jgi:hypothetical protein